MKKLLLLIILIVIPQNLFSHASHYKNYKKIEMDIFKDGKKIGYCNYVFNQKNGLLEVYNKTNFEVKLFGVKIFAIESVGVEKYKNDKLLLFESETLQNDKKKFVKLKFNENEGVYDIKGSSYTGKANSEYIIGNWWNHKILQSETQISPLSGSIKNQIVAFIKKEKIKINGKEYLAHKFSLKSKEKNLEDDKKLDFKIWLDPEKNLIIKVDYNRMGNWEYILKNIELN